MADDDTTPAPGLDLERANVARMYDYFLFFTGTELAEPGLVDVVDWRPDATVPAAPTGYYGGLGFVPGRQP